MFQTFRRQSRIKVIIWILSLSLLTIELSALSNGCQAIGVEDSAYPNVYSIGQRPIRIATEEYKLIFSIENGDLKIQYESQDFQESYWGIFGDADIERITEKQMKNVQRMHQFVNNSVSRNQSAVFFTSQKNVKLKYEWYVYQEKYTEQYIFQLQRNCLNRIDILERANLKLEQKYELLIKKHQSLAKDHQVLSKAHQILQQKHQKLEKDHILLKKNNEVLRKDHDTLKKDFQTLKKDFENLRKDHQSLKKDHLLLKTDHQVLKIDHQNIKKGFQDLQKEHQALKQDYITHKQYTEDKFNQHDQSILKITNSLSSNFIVSKIVESVQNKLLIQNWLQKPVSNFQLIFRASEHSFSSQQFHKKCDGKTDTLVLIKTQYGRILGGYTPLAWESFGNNTADNDLKSFVFSLFMKEKFPLKLKTVAIYRDKNVGPNFGHYDIQIKNNADSQQSKFKIGQYYDLNGKYTYGSEALHLAFLGKSDGSARVTEYEVYRVIWK